VGVLTRHVTGPSMIAGMLAGMSALVAIWWTGATAWTWYAFTGAAVTALVALVAEALRPRTQRG
jgi:hypothetical protein